MPKKVLSSDQYKMAAEQMASCLHNGIGAAEQRSDPHQYELRGWVGGQ
jgi:hypothetical protein